MAMDSHNRRFETTHWSVVVAAGDAESAAGRSALAALCETYWTPVYAFIRRSGRSSEEAKDLTQAFFAMLLEKNYVRDAKQERGRFRSFLLTSVRHFLANEYDHAHAQKRGGQVVHVPLEVEHGERLYQHEAVEHETPEHIYERQWALTVLEAARAQVALRFEGERRQQMFEKLRPFLTGDDPASYGDLARELGMTEGALRVAVHRVRQQWGESLRELVAETVGSPEEAADELRHLMAVLSR
jgi:RNA polymerase sigma factor (sigma-70 family)